MQLYTVAFLLSLAAIDQSQPSVSGTVVDQDRRSVENAIVRLEIGGKVIEEVRSAANGSFTFSTTATGDIRVVVIAPGFVQRVVSLTEAAERTLRIQLEPAPFFEEVEVTSSAGELARADSTFTMTVLSSDDLISAAPLMLDDALKWVPGFTLFRRTSSRVSNPTSQGMTLRGLGGSGASRSLVLVDGSPINDPFGGWVYWDRVPHAAIERVEVLRGGGSDLYGADAVGGVVQILTYPTGRTLTRAVLDGGALGTFRGSLFTGGGRRGWGYSGAGEWFTTRGYFIVPEEERGAVDARASSKHGSALGTLVYQSEEGWRYAARGTLFSEDRKNGTRAQVNDTRARTLGGRIAGGVAGGFLSVRGNIARQTYDQTFSTISGEPPRASEDVTNVQRVPATSVFVSGVWVRAWRRNSVLVGGQTRFISGHTQETQLEQGRVVGTTDQGGLQRVASVFGQGSLVVHDQLTVLVGSRLDTWHSESQTTSFSKTVVSFNPRVSVAYRIDGTGLLVRGSVYRSFRAPTLNELYRGFRVGFNVTQANEALEPEDLTAADAGLLFARGGLSARVTGFWNLLDDTVANVTLSTSPTLTVRQRQNADKITSYGVEVETEVRLTRTLSAGFTSAIISSHFRGNTALRDFRVPQVPDYTAAFRLRYNTGDWSLSGLLRVTGAQFEDDRNAFLLRRATALDVFVGRPVTRNLMAFAACENLFDTQYDVGRTFTRTVGLPRAFRVGIQLTMPGRFEPKPAANSS